MKIKKWRYGKRVLAYWDVCIKEFIKEESKRHLIRYQRKEKCYGMFVTLKIKVFKEYLWV